jgi:hypothetical protein
VNYTYSATDDYKQAFFALPIWLQEEILDELERLLAHPERLIVRGGDGLAVHDFARKTANVSHLVFLTIRPDGVSGILNLLRLGHVERQQPS